MEQRKILLSSDTPCDIGAELQERYSVSLFPLHILLGDKQYTDGKDITPPQIFDHWYKTKELPRTAAINPEEYAAYFSDWIQKGYDILHISLGSGLSSSCQNAQIAANDFDGQVYVIDSKSLSTGFGLLVCEAGERINAGMPVKQVYEEVSALVNRTSASFVLDTLEFLHAGGRCSSLAHISAAVMQIKPSIFVRHELGGAMTVGKKYMGRLDRAMLKYVDDLLKDRTDIVLDRVFVTDSTVIDSALQKAVMQRVLELQPFKEVHVTHASCTISAHCGPNCLGVLFLTTGEEK